MILPLWILNPWGWILSHWRIVLTGLGILVLIIAVVMVYRSCQKPPKLDQEAIIEAQQAIEMNDRKTMVEILANSDGREQGIDNSIKAAEEATNKAVRDYSQLSNDELAAELERRARGQ